MHSISAECSNDIVYFFFHLYRETSNTIFKNFRIYIEISIFGYIQWYWSLSSILKTGFFYTSVSTMIYLYARILLVRKKKLFSLCFPICAYGQSFGEFTLPQMSRRYIVLCLFQSIFAELNEDLHCFVFAIVKYYFHSSQFVRNKCIAHHVICMLCVSFHFQVNCSFSLYRQS